MTIILFILIFGVVVLSHEFGHFLLAKLNGIHVVEFSVGMGPTIVSLKKRDTKYSVKLLPIGGACMFEGEDGRTLKEGERSSGSFLDAGVWRRISTVLAGPIFNFLLAYLIAVVIVNIVPSWEPVASQLTEGGAAMEAGLRPGDRILSINGERIYLYDEILLFSRMNDGKEVAIRYERNGEKYETKLTPQWDEEQGKYMLGIAYSTDFAESKRFGSFRYAWYEMRYSVKATYKSLWMLLQGRVGREDVSGPVGIAVNIVGKTYATARQYGWETVAVSMLNITLLLSVNLGILNLLPVPALDGGRLVFLLVEAVRGKPIPPEREGRVHFIGLVFFMALMAYLVLNDLMNIFRA
ncbi:MAG: RIP metalloprotease RseP [Clostridium sp.]|nr:RIP metalloprotease RseP [Clostridium sp.]